MKLPQSVKRVCFTDDNLRTPFGFLRDDAVLFQHFPVRLDPINFPKWRISVYYLWAVEAFGSASVFEYNGMVPGAKREWCIDANAACVVDTTHGFWFKNEADATLFKMRWG